MISVGSEIIISVGTGSAPHCVVPAWRDQERGMNGPECGSLWRWGVRASGWSVGIQKADGLLPSLGIGQPWKAQPLVGQQGPEISEHQIKKLENVVMVSG